MNIRGAFNKFEDFFVQAFKIVVDSWKFSMLLLCMLWDGWPILMISGSNERIQQELEYTLLKYWHDLHALRSHWTDSQRGILCWGFKGVQGEIPWEEASTLQIESVAFPPGQCTNPQLHPCPWPRWELRQFLSLPIVQTLLPVTFGYSLSSEAVVMR